MSSRICLHVPRWEAFRFYIFHFIRSTTRLLVWIWLVVVSWSIFAFALFLSFYVILCRCALLRFYFHCPWPLAFFLSRLSASIFLIWSQSKELLLVVAVKSVTTSILTNTTLLFSFYLFFNYVFKSCVLWSWSDHIFTPHQYKQCISLLLWNNV